MARCLAKAQMDHKAGVDMSLPLVSDNSAYTAREVWPVFGVTDKVLLTLVVVC